MIEAEGLSRRFGAVTAVDDLSVRVPDGTILALLGPNGAGKTTTVRMLAGLLAPTTGVAMVAGHDVRRDPAAVRACIGLMTDVPGLHEQMTAPAYLAFFGGLYGLPSAARTRRIDDLLAFFDLERHRTAPMTGFSKGMKQKVALARALLHEPAALFLDEPTSGLDPLAARAVRALIVQLKQANRSIVLCTHDLDEAERLADQIAILRQGRMVACAPPAELRGRSSPETTVQVTLADPCPAALDILRETAGVMDPSVVSGGLGPEARPGLEYRTVQPVTINPQALERLVVAGARIVAVTCVTPSLEDVYAAAIGADGYPAAAEEQRDDGAAVVREPVS